MIASRSIGSVESGTHGGLVESENNLSHDGDAWVHDGALVHEHARIEGYAQVYAGSIVEGNSLVSGDASIRGATISGNSRIGLGSIALGLA